MTSSTKPNILRHTISGALSILLAVFLPFIVIAIAQGFEQPAQLLQTFFMLLAIALGLGLPLALLVEQRVVPRFSKTGKSQFDVAAKALLVYLAIGLVLDLGFWIPIYWRALVGNQTGYVGQMMNYFWASVVLTAIGYAIVAVIARGTYPLLHRVLWSTERD